jgi:alpha-tubulin suppressor-like RCC1 family protein
MTQHLGSTASLPVLTPSYGGRLRRFTRRLTPMLAAAIVAAALGCREDGESPSAPESGPALAAGTDEPLVMIEVSAGSFHSCGIASPEFRGYCWGRNGEGQLGSATPGAISQRPVPVEGGLDFRTVSAGNFHTCGLVPFLERPRRIHCWGDNSWGQLGDGTTANRSSPVPVAGNRPFSRVTSGARHTCGLGPFGAVFCWGSNSTGVLGDGTTTDRLTPTRVAGGLQFRQVSAGEFHTCGVTMDFKAYCWGFNGDGQLGDGTATQRLRPKAVLGGLQFRAVAAGAFHTCGVTRDLRAYCWGNNAEGRLGDGTTSDRRTPVAVAGGLEFRQVSAGGSHTCGVQVGERVTSRNRVHCWGRNAEGQLGDGTTTRRLTPVAVTDRQFFDVNAGNSHTCAIAEGPFAYCWGNNESGQLGDGTTTNRSRPVAVAGPM